MSFHLVHHLQHVVRICPRLILQEPIADTSASSDSGGFTGVDRSAGKEQLCLHCLPLLKWRAIDLLQDEALQTLITAPDERCTSAHESCAKAQVCLSADGTQNFTRRYS